MEFGGAWGRGIGGLRGRFLQPRQMQRLQQMGMQQSSNPYGGSALGAYGVTPQRAPTPEQIQQDMLMEREMMDRVRTMKPRTDLPDQAMHLPSHQPTAARPMQSRPQPYGGGPGFAKPLSPAPSAPDQAGGGAGGSPMNWKMSIEPMAHGGMVPDYQNGGPVRPHRRYIAGPEKLGEHAEEWREKLERDVLMGRKSLSEHPTIQFGGIYGSRAKHGGELERFTNEFGEPDIRYIPREGGPTIEDLYTRALDVDPQIHPDSVAYNLIKESDPALYEELTTALPAQPVWENVLSPDATPEEVEFSALMKRLGIEPPVGGWGQRRRRASGGMIPGYQNGGGVDPDDEKIAMMELMLREIAKGDPRFASRSPFGENPEESEWYRENILPEEKRTFGGQVVPLDSINYAVSSNPVSMRAAKSLSDLGAKNAELALLHDWAKNPENVVLPGQRSGAGSRLFGGEMSQVGPDRIRRSITPYSRFATELQARADEGRAYGGIIGLQGGGYIPMYAGGGIPGYSIGGFFRGLGKVLSKVVPTAMNFIPGLSSLSGVAKAGIGALSQGVGDISSGRDLNLQSMLGGAGRTYATSSAIDRIRDIEGLKDEGLWGGLGKVLTDKDIGKEALTALADIPFGEAQALAVTELAGQRGAAEQAADASGFGGVGMVNPMGTSGRVMPGSGAVDPVGGIAERMTYGQQPIDYSRSDGGIVPGYRKGGRTKRKDRKRSRRRDKQDGFIPQPQPILDDDGNGDEEDWFIPQPQPILPEIRRQIPQTAAVVRPVPLPAPIPVPLAVDQQNIEEEEFVPEAIAAAPAPVIPPSLLPQIQQQIPQTAAAVPVAPMVTPQTSVPDESRDWGEESVAAPYPVDRRQIPDDIEDLVPETTRSLRRKEAVATPTDTQRAAFEAEQRRYAEEGADVAPPSAAPPVESPSMADRQRDMATREQAAMSATTGEFDPADLSGELPATMAGYVPPARLPEDWRDEELEEEGAESDAAYQKTIDSLERRREIRLADASEEEKEALKLPEDLGPGVVGIGEAPVDWERLAKDPDYDPYAKPHTPTDEERAAVEKEKERHAQSTTSAGSITPTTRSGTGVGSGFYGEQKWFDPNAPDPAKRDIGGFSPHELPRTSADFAVAGDAGGADLLSRLNAPAAPVQNYLSPAPVPGAAEGGLVDIGQVPMDRLERLAKAAQQIESPGSQQIIEQAIEDFGVEMVNQIVTMIQQQGPMTAPDGSVPEYGIGGFLKKLGKAATLGGTQLLPKRIRDPINRGVLKAAPVAANFIPGVGPIAAAGIGAVAKGIEGRMDAADRDREAAAVPQDQLIDAPQLEEDPLTALPSPQPQRYMPNPAAWQAPAQQEVAGQMTYGHEDWARGGLINGGGGDAMADDILVNAEMGMNGERQPIAVSAGEYIVPGDVLAHLGSGNTEEGGEVMDQFVEDVRVQRTGSPEQPAPIDLRDVLPGTYGERYG